MDPTGYFSGSTVHATWRPVVNAQSYSVSIEQCNEDNICSQVFHILQPETKLVATSKDFEACTIYILKVIAVGDIEERILKETIHLRKSHNECNKVLELSLTVVLSLLAVIALIILAGVIYYHRKKPIQKLQRARSRVYSKLYPREKYERPYSKEEFMQKVSSQQPVGFFVKINKSVFPNDKDEVPDSTDLLEQGLSRFNSIDYERKSDFLAEEFLELEQLAFDTIQRRTQVSSPPVNRRRNRYQDIVPFDATRVILQKQICIDGEAESSDFINASYISDVSVSTSNGLRESLSIGASLAQNNNGKRKESQQGLTKHFPNLGRSQNTASQLSSEGPRRYRFGLHKNMSDVALNQRPIRYIAAQGPGEETSLLFWEMIWQENVRVIIMLTNLIEGYGFNSVKCAMYWPDIVGGVKRFNDLKVQLYDVQEAPDYKVHKLELSRRTSNSSREIVHIQCTSWPDRSAPEDANTLLQLIEVTRALAKEYNDKSNPGPWLVHCSAGVGRTGTFIAVDQLIRMIDDPKRHDFDIFNLVYQLRKDRRYMVQTQSQYAYVYKCVFEYLKRKQITEAAEN